MPDSVLDATSLNEYNDDDLPNGGVSFYGTEPVVFTGYKS